MMSPTLLPKVKWVGIEQVNIKKRHPGTTKETFRGAFNTEVRIGSCHFATYIFIIMYYTC